MINEMILYALSAVIIVLGFVSLFTQKVYTIDKETGAEIEVELPFFGKLKTNIPAAAFVLIGAFLAYHTFDKTCEVTDHWVINGQFTAPESSVIDWGRGYLMLSPAMLKPAINPNGTFEIQGTIRRGAKFEDVVEQISYCNWCGNQYGASILTKGEYEKHEAGEPSNLENVGPRMRVYRPLPVTFYPTGQQ